MENRLPHGRNLLKQLDLEGEGPCTATRSEFMKGFVVGDGVGKASIYNRFHRLLHHLHETYAAVVTAFF